MKLATQRGFTIVSAIFILVVLAALGAFIVTVSTTQEISSAMDVQGSRAYQAARSGIEWGVYQVQSGAAYGFGHANDPLTTSPNLRNCAGAAGSFAFPASAPTLSNFTVTVTCNVNPDTLSRTGTITTSTASAAVTGIGTSFTTELAVGLTIYTAAGSLLGTIASITNNTNLTLTANAASSNAGINYAYSLGGPTVFRVAATACNQPSAGSCPNTTNPSSNYIERRLEVLL